jgi:SAM-dependent methyltransferase
MSFKQIALTAAAVMVGSGAVFAVTPLGRDLIYHLVPPSWTGEPDRLAVALQVAPGSVVADIGAGDGAIIVDLARRVGATGHAYASEMTPAQRDRIRARASSAGVPLTIVEGAEDTTNLPDGCCDAVFMRMVMHHVRDAAVFARALQRSLRPGGRLAVIDFAPGALLHLAGSHGIDPAQVVAAFTAAGFTVSSHVDDWGGRNFLIVFRAP